MRIAVIGSGSLGLLWASRMARLSYEVTVVTRTIQQHEQIVQAGICCEELDGEIIHTYVHSCPIEFAGELPPFDIIFITVKQYQLNNIMAMVQSCSHPFTQIIFWQNGLGQEDAIQLLQYRPDTYVAITTEGAYRKSEAQVAHTGQGETWIGTFPHQNKWKPLLREFIQQLQQVVVSPIMETDAIFQRMWEKLAVNAVINPLTSILEVPNGELVHLGFDQVIENITAETCQVARSLGIELDHVKTVKKIKEVCRLTAPNTSSMLQDIQRGTLTEIDAINGAILRYAKEHNIPIYYHELLYALVKAKEEHCMQDLK